MSDNNKKKIKYKPKAISGYPEWLPEYRRVELEWIDTIRSVFESYGFCSIETSSVEELAAIEAKGAADKEIYTLTRLHAEEDSKKDARLALHFDLTVPLARYTALNFNDLVFPFKRYQIQKVWRGERPQKGRFREFYQCDIDVINVDNLPMHFDAEMPRVMHNIYTKLNIPEKIQIRISNRKILTGYLQHIGIEESKIADTTRILDKLDKIGEEKVLDSLLTEIKLEKDIAKLAVEFTKINGKSIDNIGNHLSNIQNSYVEEGIEELSFVMNSLRDLPDDRVEIIYDMSVIRGLDYYTGTIIEANFAGNRNFGAIGAGGRYDNLAESFINRKLPGIGISIGLTRLFSYMKDNDLLNITKYSPTEILVVQENEDSYMVAMRAAITLRNRGFKVELFHNPTKLKKQIKYAEEKNIPYLWFLNDDGAKHQVKNMQTREQIEVDIKKWQPR